MNQRESPVFTPRLGCLPPIQQSLWPNLQPLRDRHFVLYGGTAIALRLGHRVSVDFDFFSTDSLKPNMIGEALPFLGYSILVQSEENALTYLVPMDRITTDPDLTASDQTVKVSLFGGLTIGRIGQPQLTSDGVALVASAKDLLASKLKVILQRAESKDYIDIAALLSADQEDDSNLGRRLAEGLSAAAALYGSTFQPAEALKALVFFDDGNLDLLSRVVRQVLEAAVTQLPQLPAAPVVTPQLH